jgi:hypothetical protein
MDKPESEPEEIQAEVGHIVHEVTRGEGDLKDQPVPVHDVYDFRQRIVKPGELIEPEGEPEADAASGPPPPLPPAEELPDQR